MLILASASPRRRELMEKLETPYLCRTSDAEETLPEGMPAEEAPSYLAEKKAETVFHTLTKEERAEAVVIGSDTVVLCDGKILGKPRDAAEAKRMLLKLSGKTHEVLTGVCLCSAKKRVSFISCTKVEFYPLSEAEIDRYIATGEPMDKAGAYGIQGAGALLVKRIDGDYYTVVGFPIAELSRRLSDFTKQEPEA